MVYNHDVNAAAFIQLVLQSRQKQ